MTGTEQEAAGLPEWLARHSREEWFQLALGELARAERALSGRDVQAGIPGLKRAAGMALNAALRRVWREAWGRTYVEHLEALSGDEAAPAAVRSAAAVLHAAGPSGAFVAIGSRQRDQRLCEAARTVMAHAYALAFGSTGTQRASQGRGDEEP